jgi:hypothetical protein
VGLIPQPFFYYFYFKSFFFRLTHVLFVLGSGAWVIMWASNATGSKINLLNEAQLRTQFQDPFHSLPCSGNYALVKYSTAQDRMALTHPMDKETTHVRILRFFQKEL